MRWKLAIFNKMSFHLSKMDFKNYTQTNNHPSLMVINVGNIFIKYRIALDLPAEVIQNNSFPLKNGLNSGKVSSRDQVADLTCIY